MYQCTVTSSSPADERSEVVRWYTIFVFEYALETLLERRIAL